MTIWNLKILFFMSKYFKYHYTLKYKTSKIKFHEESNLSCWNPMVLENASAYARNVASKINERAKASTSASCISRVVERKGAFALCTRLLFYFRQFAPLKLEKGQDALSFSRFLFCIFFFLSATLLLKWVGASFEGNVATATTEGYITGKMPKETKENGEVGKSNEFSGCLVPLFRLCPFSYLAISSSHGAVKSFVWTTREGSQGSRYFPRKVSTRRKFNGFIDHANFRPKQRRILKKKKFMRSKALSECWF